MTATPFNPTTQTDRQRDAPQKWPVLARLPDVSPQMATATRSNRAAAAGFVEYRFDPPQAAGGGAGARHTVLPGIRTYAGKETTQPHVFRRDLRAGTRPRPKEFASPILPHSDPFAIPRTGLGDMLAPVIRFLMMFALFTAAGTAILMFNRQAQPKPEPIEPAVTTAQQTLEPAADAIQPPPNPPTASGPLDATRTGRRATGGSQSANRHRHFKKVSEISGTLRTRVHRGTLPRVQMSDLPARDGASNPPPVARLSRYILEVPSRQAQHDENQSSLH